MITLVQGLRDKMSKVDISADMLQGQWGYLAGVPGGEPAVVPVSQNAHARLGRARLVMVAKEAIALNGADALYETIEANDGSANDDGKFPYAFFGGGYIVEDDQLTSAARTLANWAAAVRGVTRLSLNVNGFPTFEGQADYIVNATEIGTFWGIYGNAVYYLIDELGTITPHAPVAGDEEFHAIMNQVISGNVLTNDADQDADQLAVNVNPVVDVAHGTLVLNADGTFTYTPDNNYVGDDEFTYEVSDGNAVPLSDEGKVTITMHPKIAVDDAWNTAKNTALNDKNVLTNDVAPGADSLIVNTTPVTDVTHGTLVLAADGSFTYTPDNDYIGDDTFVYEVSNDGDPSLTDQGTVTITVQGP